MLMLILKFLNNLKGWFAICLVIVDKSRLNCEECTRKKKKYYLAICFIICLFTQFATFYTAFEIKKYYFFIFLI
jgi:hypothetical protein